MWHRSTGSLNSQGKEMNSQVTEKGHLDKAIKKPRKRTE